MIRHFLLPLSAFALLFFPQAISAQENATKARVKFSCLIWDELPMKEIFYKDGTSFRPIEFQKGKRSVQYPLKRAQAFELYIPNTNSDAKPKYILVGKTALVPNARTMLFVVFPKKNKAGLPLTLIGVDDSWEGFPPGSFRFANFTNTSLLVKVREKVSKLEAGKFTVVDSQATADGGLVPVAFGNRQGEQLYFTRLYSHSRSREMVFIGQPTHPKKKFSFKYLPQNIPRPAKTP